jgi:DNA-binding transcriptional LysR family regulator
VDLLIGTDQEVKHWVEHNIADIGLAYELDTQKSEVIFTDQYYAISSHNMSLPSKLTMPILSNEGFIMSSSGCEQAINNIFDQSNSQLNIKTTVSDMNALFAIVGSGYGVSIVPGLAFPENWSEVVKRHSLSPQLKCTLSMQTPKKKKDQQFIEVLNIAIKQVAESLG